MPLISGVAIIPDEPGTGPEVPPEPPGVPPDPYVRPAVGLTWTAPDGVTHDLMRFIDGPIALQDWVGFGAAPRVVTRQSLHTGGTYGRWSHADERILGVPLLNRADDHIRFLQLRRELTLAFTQTSPPFGEPKPGVLRVTRSDGSWREISAVYESGLEWNEGEGSGVFHDLPVLQLVAPDPWWYGEQSVAVDFEVAAGRDYLDPYETVSPEAVLGTQQLLIAGDIPVSPVWTIRGPASSVTAGLTGGPSWTFVDVGAGETVTVDTAAKTVTNQNGANRISGLSWPTSTLFQMPAGAQNIVVNLQGGVPGPPASSITLAYRPRFETA